ncbi:MAG TPA: GNAT family N-acetyltransferase [Azospirillaceae bacterium]|nr:GNAT family N-acetyltransferase [Azospirillaceae bacterium]
MTAEPGDGGDDPIPPVRTARLLLRCVRPDDAPAVSALMTPGVSARVASWPSPMSLETAGEFIRRARVASERRRAVHYGIFPAGDEGAALMGWISVRAMDEPAGLGALGYWMGEPHQGRGYTTEAARAVLGAAFLHLALDRIEAGAQVDNAASLAVLRRIGMRPTGERMVHAPSRGRDEPCLFFEIGRAEAGVSPA